MEQTDWIMVDDKLPDFDVDVIVFGKVKQMSPTMNGNPPRVLVTRRMNLKGSGFEKSSERNKPADKYDFRYMEETYCWQHLPTPPKQF